MLLPFCLEHGLRYCESESVLAFLVSLCSASERSACCALFAHAGRTLAIIGPASATGTNKLRGRIRRALRRADGDDGWMTTSALHSALGGHVRGNDLRDALAQMVADLDVAQRDGEVSAAGGRPADYWRWNQRTREEV